MNLQELQTKALQLSTSDRQQLVQILLDSLKQETQTIVKSGNLSRLRGIAKISGGDNFDPTPDYITYLTEKYQ